MCLKIIVEAGDYHILGNNLGELNILLFHQSEALLKVKLDAYGPQLSNECIFLIVDELQLSERAAKKCSRLNLNLPAFRISSPRI